MRNGQLVFQRGRALPSAARETSRGSASLPALGVVSLFVFCYFGGRVMVSRCGFNVHVLLSRTPFVYLYPSLYSHIMS